MKKPIEVKIIKTEPNDEEVKEQNTQKNYATAMLIVAILAALIAILNFFGIGKPQKVIPVTETISITDEVSNIKTKTPIQSDTPKVLTEKESNIKTNTPIPSDATKDLLEIDYELLGEIFKNDMHSNSDNIIYLDFNNNYSYQDDNHSGRYYTSWLNEYEDNKRQIVKDYNVVKELDNLEVLSLIRCVLEKGMDLKHVEITFKGKETYRAFLER